MSIQSLDFYTYMGVIIVGASGAEVEERDPGTKGFWVENLVVASRRYN